MGIIRSLVNPDSYRDGEICIAFKYTAQGLGHGHYDKLSYSLYDDRGEIVQDYGAARWVNIDQKGGGRYLPENRTWAKQTIGHNTVTVNEKSHFGGKFKVGNEHHSDKFFFDVKNENFQIASAKETNAYPGTEMHRTMALLKDDEFQNPLVIDVFRVKSDKKNQYDLVTVSGEVTVKNHKTSEIRLDIRRTITGSLEKTNPEWLLSQRTNFNGTLNDITDVCWELELEAGQELTIKYEYEIYVR